jgi:hypothetical protein
MGSLLPLAAFAHPKNWIVALNVRFIQDCPIWFAPAANLCIPPNVSFAYVGFGLGPVIRRVSHERQLCAVDIKAHQT